MPMAALRDARFALAFLAMTLTVGARAEDLPQPAQQRPAPSAPSGQESGPGGRGGGTPASPSAAEAHKLPPDSTTKQTLLSLIHI